MCRRGGPILRALITGIGGFAGSHLAEYLCNNVGMEVAGILSPRGRADNLAALGDSVSLHRADLLDSDAVAALLDTVQPDRVYHLAARASVGASWQDPASTLHNNIMAQLNVLRTLAESGARPRVLVVASAEEYGRVGPYDLPVDEATPLRPVNPYAVSKVTQDYMGLQYYLSHDLSIVRVRPFNHSGPRQELGYVVPDFSSQIAEIEAGTQEPRLKVGNLDAERDMHDVRDTVRAYYLALEHGQAGEVYNVGGSQAYAIREVLDRLLALSHVPVQVEPDPGRMRPSDVPRIVADCSKLERETGWVPAYSLDRTLRDTLDYWRDRVQRARPALTTH
jgi:GDP-4-dehydro-6-deoxy-D-mannose reductase